LITGVCVVALLGKFLPHDPRLPPQAAPERPPASRSAEPAQAKPQPAKSAPAKPTEAAKKPAAPTAKAGPQAEAAKPKTGIAALMDRGPVSNSPWNGSVKQVERYLKNRLYDAASFEALEWSPVVENKKGYQVRCKYRSKNVLGVYVTQSKTFFLDKSGEVYAVKE
jgi:hypothetical protein